MSHYSNRHKALFLDRDGVINIDHGYVGSRERFHFVDGIFDLVQVAQSFGYKTIVVTNQAGIARRYYTEADLDVLHSWMLSCFASRNLALDAIYYCPFHPTKGKGGYLHDSYDRKPKPGMLCKAISDHTINPSRSILIGDSPTDILAAQAADVSTSILLSSTTYVDCHPTYQIRQLMQAVTILNALER